MSRVFFLSFYILLAGSIQAQNDLQTIAESSDFQSTSNHQEVKDFIDVLLVDDKNIRKEVLAYSTEGREIPLLIIADPMPDSPEDLQDDERIVVYLQGNIHAGEVEGKEASLMLARDILNDKRPKILEDVVILICPNFNPDGNEKISPRNRTNQNGPVNGVGTRYNGQYLDLNRDAMKAETPEMQGLITNVLNRWDPAVTVDCHTTNGSFHEEPVTFTWMMNPNGDRNLINFMRDDMMPKVSEELLRKYKVENVFYGEFIDRLDIEKGWISYAAEPRYLVNYIGLRNRLAILNENYAYADYKSRVYGCYYLLKSILEYSAHNKIKIKRLLASADSDKVYPKTMHALPDSFAIEYRGVPTPEKVTIKAIEADTIPGVRGYWRYRPSDRKRTISIPYIADYYPTKSVLVPYAYIISFPDKEVIENLKTHGIQLEKLKEATSLDVERFKISELKGSNRLNQGHYTNSLKGEFVKESNEFPNGTYIVFTAQKLGNLASYLLEPQTDDGLLKWNYFDKYLVPQWGRNYYPYPVYRLMQKTNIETESE